jgi:hypothetical protein
MWNVDSVMLRAEVQKSRLLEVGELQCYLALEA